MPKEGTKSEKTSPKVDADVMKAFNSYTDWLKEKGYAGTPEMNHKSFSEAAFTQYKKEHPETILTTDHFLPIQQAIHDYRNSTIDQLKSGKYQTEFNANKDYSNFMSAAATPLGSKDDGLVGQYTSQFKFPSAYMEAKIPPNRIGFASQVDIGSNKNATNLQVMKPMQTGEGIFYGGKRVGELFRNDGKTYKIKFRNDTDYTGEEVQIKPEELQKYVGTGNSIPTTALYNEIKKKGVMPIMGMAAK